MTVDYKKYSQEFYYNDTYIAMCIINHYNILLTTLIPTEQAYLLSSINIIYQLFKVGILPSTNLTISLMSLIDI